MTISIIGTGSDDVIDVSSSSTPHRIEGRNGNDRLTGSSAADVIVAGAGYDTVRGGGGDDVFIVEGTGQGEDQVFGDAGFDAIMGGAGNDTIALVSMGTANSIERIDGGGGFNVITGNLSENTLDFSGMTLVNIGLIDGLAGNDRITGSSGNDLIAGGTGHDTLRGGGGIDTALFAGNAASYQVTGIGTSQVTVRHVSGLVDTLYDFSFAQFDDGTVSLSGGPQPVAGADSGQTAEDGSVTLDVLSNDSNGGSGTLSVAGVTQGAHGSVTLNANGTVTYTPQANYAGPDSFSYTLSNGTGATSGTVSVTVTPVNDAPVANNDGGFTTPLDTARTFTPSALLGNDTDVDGDALTIAGVGNASGGTVALVDGNVVFTPTAGYSGAAGFDYTASDGKGGQDTGRVSLTVQAANVAPVAGDDTVNASGSTTIAVLGNDSDMDGGTLSISGFTQPGHGTLTLNPNNTFTYIPAAGYTGSDSFTYTLSDGQGGQDTATVSITVSAPSLITRIGTGSDDVIDVSSSSTPHRIEGRNGNDRLTGSSAADVIVAGAGYDTVRGGGGDDVFIVEGTGQGEDQVFGDAGFDAIMGGAGNDTIALVSMGTANSIERIDGGGGFNVITGNLSENTLDFSGMTLVNIGLIDGLAGNDRITGSSGNDLIAGGTGHDTLRGGGGIDTALFAGNAASYQVTGIGTSQVTVRHVSGLVDTLYDFSFAQFDDGTVSLSGGPQPVAGADSGQTAEDGSVTLDVLSNDSNGGSGTLSVAGVTQGAHGSVTLNANGTVTYTPQANYAGPDSFSYTLSNGTGATSGTVSVTVTPVNDAPVANNDGGFTTPLDTARTFTPSALLGNDTDVDGDALTIAGVGNASGGTVALVDGNVVFTPTAGYSGAAGFDYTASDGKGGQDTGRVSLTVQAANVAPVAGDDTVNASGSTTIAVLGNDSDMDGGTLSISGFTQPGHGTLTLNPNNTFTYIPAAGYTGSDSFTYTLSDGQGGQDTATVSITVSAPSLITRIGTGSDDVIDVSSSSTPHRIEGRNGNDRLTGSSAADVIVAGAGYDTVRGGGGDDVFIVEGTGQGEDQVFGDAGFDAIMGGAGNDTIALVSMGTANSIERIDGGGGFNVITGNLSENTLDFSGMTLVNIGLIDGLAGNDRITGSSGNDLIAGGTGHDTLRGGGGIDTALFAGNAASYQVTGIGTSQVTVRHVSGLVDTLYDFSFAQFDDGTVSLSGGPQPVAGADSGQTAEDGSVTLDVLSNDSNGGSGTLSVAGVTQGAHGSVTLNANGTVTYTPQANYAGPDSFSYTLSNGTGATSGTVSVTVTPVNDAPVANNDGGFTTPLDTARTFTPSALLGNDTDVDGDALTIAGVGNASGGTVALVDGNVVFTPTAGYSGAAGFDYTASDGKGGQDTGRVSISVAEPPPASSGFRQILVNGQEGGWISLNTNSFASVATPGGLRPGTGLPLSVINAWGSMAWDSNRGDLIFWGGGHANYAGNEIYRWRSSTLSWERASLPSQIVNISGARYEAIDGVDNAPISSHTYDNNEFLPIADRFMTWGGAAYNTGGAFVDTAGQATGPYFWDPSKADGNKVGGTTGSGVDPSTLGGEMWENRDNLPAGERPGDSQFGFLGGTTAYATENGKDVIYISDGDLWKYTVNDVNNAALDTYEKLGNGFNAYNVVQGAGAVDIEHDIFVRTTGNANFTYWDLSQAGAGNRNQLFVPTDASGLFEFNRLSSYGMDFDPVRRNFVLWNGGAEVWILTPPEILSTSGWTLTRNPLSGFGPVPTELGTGTTTATGVLGKWKYIAEQDIFLGVIDYAQGTVWAYKPGDWQPENSLPSLTVEDQSDGTLATGATMSANDFVDWSDADGDRVQFTFTDQTATAGSGFFRLNDVDQAANVALTVTDTQLQAGALVWVAGNEGGQDQVRVAASDPFGTAAPANFLSPAVMANLLAQAPLIATMSAGTDKTNTLLSSNNDPVYLAFSAS